MVRFIVDCKECKTTKERAQKVVIELLHNFQGAVQTDGYDVYSIYENKKGVLLLSCWAHARRKYTEVLKEDKSGAELRQRLAYPILVAFEK